MALCRLTYASQAMNRKIGVSIIIPENKWGYSLADRPLDYRYPTLWLLCGGGYDHTDWQRYSAIEYLAAKRGIAVVMPGISYACYVDTYEGDYRYWTQISQELPEYLRKLFPLSTRREDNFVAGFSMGGYGAFKWAMQQPEMFAACGTFAGPIGIVPQEPIPPTEKLGQPCLRDDFCEEQFSTIWAAFGPAGNRRGTGDDNLYMLGKHLEAGDSLPEFYIAVGAQDPTAADNYVTMDTMHQMGLSFLDIRDEGKHDWEYCNRHIDRFIHWLKLENTFEMEDQ